MAAVNETRESPKRPGGGRGIAALQGLKSQRSDAGGWMSPNSSIYHYLSLSLALSLSLSHSFSFVFVVFVSPSLSLSLFLHLYIDISLSDSPSLSLSFLSLWEINERTSANRCSSGSRPMPMTLRHSTCVYRRVLVQQLPKTYG